MKKKILVDLDVITVGIWIKSDMRKKAAKDIMNRSENKEFYIISPVSLLDLVEKWRNKPLAQEIRNFYIKNTDKFINEAQIIEHFQNVHIDVNQLINLFEKIYIKREDIILLLCCVIEDCALITFNRKHLKDNEHKINEILKEYQIKINIKLPTEI